MSVAKVLDVHAQKLSDLFKVPLEHVVRLREYGLLDPKAVRDFLIYNDYCVLMKTKKLNKTQIYKKLAGIYDVEIEKVRRVASERINRMYFCRACGEKVSKKKFINNGGLCDKCFSSSIKI